MPIAFQIIFFIILAVAAPPIKGMDLDVDTNATNAVSRDNQIKCGGCPCNNPCYTASPPPPPPPPPKMPSSTPGLNCPPPPTGGGYALAPPAYIYITSPPGNLYPVNPYFSGAHRNLWAAPLLLVVSGLLGVLIFC